MVVYCSTSMSERRDRLREYLHGPAGAGIVPKNVREISLCGQTVYARENNLFMQIDERVLIFYTGTSNTHCTRRIDYSQTETSVYVCVCVYRYPVRVYFKLPINLYIIATAVSPRIETFSEYV